MFRLIYHLELKIVKEKTKMFSNLNVDKEQNIICPITQEVMQDPVIASDGTTYERKAIEDWLANHDTSPLTGKPLANKELTPNYALKNCIKDLIEQQNAESKLKSRIEKLEEDLSTIKQTTQCFDLYASLNEKPKLMITSKIGQDKAQIEWDKNDDKGRYELLKTLELDKDSYSYLKLDFKQTLSDCTQLQRHALKNDKEVHPSTEEFWNENPDLRLKWIGESYKYK